MRLQDKPTFIPGIWIQSIAVPVALARNSVKVSSAIASNLQSNHMPEVKLLMPGRSSRIVWVMTGSRQSCQTKNIGSRNKVRTQQDLHHVEDAAVLDVVVVHQ